MNLALPPVSDRLFARFSVGEGSRAMVNYATVQISFAESDFHPEEREFMARLWDR